MVPGDPNRGDSHVLHADSRHDGSHELFLTAPEDGPKKLITATWDDAPHLSKRLAPSCGSRSPHEVEARTQGRPTLGSGAVYPISEADIVVDDFKVPDAAALMVWMSGWNKTAAIFGAHDRDNDVAYLTSEHYRDRQSQSFTRRASKGARRMDTRIDPPGCERQKPDRRTAALSNLSQPGLKLQSATRRELYYVCWMRLSTRSWKVFRSCRHCFFNESPLIFCRDENGNIIAENKFHLMVATRHSLSGL